jgi:aldehyde:ferredoxin oxidoreductase
MINGYAGKMLFVDLTDGTSEVKALTEQMAKDFVGGYGIGARVLYDMMKPGADPLGPDNVLGFVSGPLNGTGALFGGRYTVVCKSPVTGEWNDANSGGFFGPELKKAGFDAVFVSGAAKKPVYIYINDGKVEIRDATAAWGKDCTESLDVFVAETGEKNLRAALIGPAGEKLSLMACVINDKHRAAGRGGLGAVMGSKNLKAVVARGTAQIPVADRDALKQINSIVLDYMKNGPTAQQVQSWGGYGTGGMTNGSGLMGDSPVKNWGGVGAIDMGEESLNKLSSYTFDGKYRSKKYACAQCPLGCGANYKVADGEWPVGDTDRPEYETLAAFGSMCLNDNIESILKCNDLCNRYGLDTISVGATVAWAIECYENGLFSDKDMDGIKATWGNAAAVVALTQALVDQKTAFGKILAKGSAGAAKELGKGAEYLQCVRGVELPMHDPRFSPMFARTYQYDPTPARHVKGGMGIPDFRQPPEVRYTYGGRGGIDAFMACATEIMNCAGSCMFGGFSAPPDALGKSIEAVTGWAVDLDRTGKRIMAMRQVFNVREGHKRSDDVMPGRSVGKPPLKEGPVKNVTIDHEKLADDFFDAMGWDKVTLAPTKDAMTSWGGMDDVIKDIFG